MYCSRREQRDDISVIERGMEELADKLGVTRHTIIAIENERYDLSL